MPVEGRVRVLRKDLAGRRRNFAARVACGILLTGLSLPGLFGCLVLRREKLPPAALASSLRKATLEELLAKIEAQERSVQTLSATVEVEPSVRSLSKGEEVHYRDVQAFILIRRPASLRMIGLYPVVKNTAFDLASDGNSFGLYIPAKNRFIIGQNEGGKHSESALENLRPQHILEALLWKGPEPGKERAALEAGWDGQKAYYIVYILRSDGNQGMILARKFWFERQGLSLERLQVFDDAGEEATDVRYADYDEFSGVSYPKKIVVNRPQDQYGLSLEVSKLEFNQTLGDEKFSLEQPRGAEVIRLDQKAAREAAQGG